MTKVEKIIHGESTEVLKGLDDNSVDSVVCDPPYGLSKEPDITKVLSEWVSGDASFVPDGKGFMSKEWDGFVPPPSLWREVYRVLKPGGHALVFAGTRTQDLMTISLRLAGFEVRDVIEWLYFSGFPKSHDVSKAFDRRNGRNYPDDDFREYLKERARSAGMTGAQVDRELGTNGMWGHYVGRSQPAFPTVDAWQRMKTLLNLDNRYDEIIYRVEAEREKVGESDKGSATGSIVTTGTGSLSKVYDITAPATELAHKWAGWGTSTKPSHEPVIVVSKPKTVEDVLDEKLKEVANCLSLFVKIAVQNSTLSLQDYAEELDSVRNRVVPKNNIQDVLSGVTDTSQLKTLTENINWSTALSCLITLGDRLKNGNTSTTEMVLNTIIELKTLKYFQSLTTLESIIKDATNPDGANLSAETAAELLNDDLLRLSEILTPRVPASATSKQDGKDSYHRHEPIIVVRKPLIDADTGRKLTVADCVEKYGTGAINIDASRIAYTDEVDLKQQYSNFKGHGTQNHSAKSTFTNVENHDNNVVNTEGRFPANCITLDSDEFYSKYFNVANITPQELSKKASKKDRNSDWKGEEITLEPRNNMRVNAPRASEAEKHATTHGNNHPTVKPTDLMAWLVRLITPPNGVVLDPFAGSGSTLVAAKREGFGFIGVELTEEYIPIIEARVGIEAETSERQAIR